MEQTKGRDSQESSARNSYAITPHDSNEVGTTLPRAVYVGGAGDIKMSLEGDAGVFVTFVGATAGSILPVRPAIVHTDTTATSLVALY